MITLKNVKWKYGNPKHNEKIEGGLSKTCLIQQQDMSHSVFKGDWSFLKPLDT